MGNDSLLGISVEQGTQMEIVALFSLGISGCAAGFLFGLIVNLLRDDQELETD